MCFLADCHSASLVAGRFRHPETEKGNCLVCHSQHGSKYGAHIVSDQRKLCTACHPLTKQAESAATADARGQEKGEDFHDAYLQLFQKLQPDPDISCGYCHGDGLRTGGVTPDLRWSSAQVHATWQDIVLDVEL